jgi:hypothetical protein
MDGGGYRAGLFTLYHSLGPARNIAHAPVVGYQFLSDTNSEYTVIAVIGADGVGKSTIAAEFGPLGSASRSKDAKASIAASDGQHENSAGIDVLVTAERVIILDSQVRVPRPPAFWWSLELSVTVSRLFPASVSLKQCDLGCSAACTQRNCSRSYDQRRRSTAIGHVARDCRRAAKRAVSRIRLVCISRGPRGQRSINRPGSAATAAHCRHDSSR